MLRRAGRQVSEENSRNPDQITEILIINQITEITINNVELRAKTRAQCPLLRTRHHSAPRAKLCTQNPQLNISN